MAFIYNLTDTWNDAATTWNGIKLAVTNSGSDASSKLLNLTVTGASTASFVVDKSGNLVLNGSVNKITMTAPATGATLTLADGSTFVTSGAYSSTFTFTGTTTLTFPTSGTVTALGNTTTGSGSIVLATSPSLVTPALGTPTSGDFSSGTFTWPTFNQNTTGTAANVTGVVAIANGGTGQTTANAAFNALAPSQGGNSGKYLTTDGTNTSWASNPLGTVTSVDVSGGTTGLSFSGGPITTSGTITMSGTLAAANGGTGITSLGSGIATWLGTPSSANLAAAVTDETGSGALVFGTSPTIGSPTITGTATFNGSSSGTVSLRAPAVAGTTSFQLPANNGTSGYVLVTDGLGNTSWAVSGGAAGTAAGVNKNIQFNDAGNMAGAGSFNFDKTTNIVSLGVASSTTGQLAFYNASSANATTIQAGNASAAVTYTLPTADGTNGQALITNGSGALSWTTIASGLTVGSTAITGGTSGRILYDNAGVLGEKAVTGTGDVVLATSPTLITPALGTPTSGNFSTGTFTWPTFNQNTSGTAAGLSATLAVASGGTGLTSGTSGGVLYYSASGTLASSAALAANAIVIGGGAGVAPSTTTTGTGILTFLGTPSSANLAAAVTDETGSGALVFGTTPTFTTNITAPLVIGGTTVSSSLTLQSTSGVGTSDSILFKVGNNGATTAATITTAGDVGIGTASPAYHLTEYKTSGAAAIASISAGSTGSDSGNLVIQGGSYVAQMTQYGNGGCYFQSNGTSFNVGLSGAYPLTFYTNLTERMRIDSSGNVLIGTTTSPSSGSGQLITNGSIAIGTSNPSSTLARNLTINGSAATSYAGFVLQSANIERALVYASNTEFYLGSTASIPVYFVMAGSERFRIDTSGNIQQSGGGLLMPGQQAPTSKAAAATLTGAELITGILNTTGTTYTITLPTGTNIEGALTWSANNVALDWFVINTASGTITIAANGNTTLGTLTVATGVSAHFRIRRTATNTFTVYRMC